MRPRCQTGTSLHLCRHGKEDAFDLLLDRHYEYVLKLCWRMTGHRDEAMDLTQEVFTRLITYLARINPQPSLRPWLRRVAINLCLTALSSSRRRNGESGASLGGTMGTRVSGRGTERIR